MIGKKLNIVLVGAGGMGKRWARVVGQIKSATLVAVVDKDLAKAETLARQVPNCRAFARWQNVIADQSVSALIVATPHKFLAPISIAALKNGKHVLCEKPGGINSRQIKQVTTLAQRQHLTYMVGFNHRYHPAFLKARQLFNKGTIGDLIFIRARYGFGGRPGYEKEWRLDKKLSGGGELMDQGVHMIDLALSFMGPVKDVCGFAQNTFWKSNADDNALVLLRNKKQQTASVHVSLTQWKPLHNFEIYGTKGYLSIEGLGRRYGGTEKLTLGLRDKNFSHDSKEKTFICDPEADNSLVKELKEFIAAIKQGRSPIPDGQDAYETLKIVETIYDHS
ncbi:MAG: Gfo/Idh/MocA family oxidoreductase [Microgenomates group bacterium]